MSASIRAVAPALAIVDGIPTTTSTDVAVFFGKRHDNVLNAIRALRDQVTPGCLPNFQEASIEVEQPNGGKATYPGYRLTRDGFMLLAMGFTGKKALAFKVAYIDAFNRMERKLSAGAAQAKGIPQGARYLLIFDDDGKGHFREVAPHACAIDPNSKSSLQTLIGEYVPFDLIPFVLQAAASRINTRYEAMKKHAAAIKAPL